MLVVAPAAQHNPFRIVQVGPREPVDVIELEHACLLAPVPACVDKGAASAVASVDVAPDRGRYLPRRRRPRNVGCFGSRLANRS
ncbi:MAG: hypothetical protein ACJ79V_13635, partial [Myxococcales bacterium]